MKISSPVFPGFRGELHHDEPMSCHTSLKVGGPADLYAVPLDQEDLLLLVRYLDDAGLSRMVIGGGYNLLVRDGGFRGAVISLDQMNRIERLNDASIRAEAGAENLAVVRFAQRHRLGGIGFIAGIPGTIGGAVRMNAGAYGCGLLEHIGTLTLLRKSGRVNLGQHQLEYGYRHLELAPDDIILSACLSLENKDPAETEDEIRRDLELRRTKHAVGFPSAGSFFKNPLDQAAWRLIDAAGMRGYTVGGAQMSELHSNFMINRGGASASDCLKLASLVKEAVLKTAGVTLEEEVRIVGEDV